jgi:hypothetical protein
MIIMFMLLSIPGTLCFFYMLIKKALFYAKLPHDQSDTFVQSIIPGSHSVWLAVASRKSFMIIKGSDAARGSYLPILSNQVNPDPSRLITTSS